MHLRTVVQYPVAWYLPPPLATQYRRGFRLVDATSAHQKKTEKKKEKRRETAEESRKKAEQSFFPAEQFVSTLLCIRLVR